MKVVSKRNPNCSDSLEIMLDYRADYRATFHPRCFFASDGSDGSDGKDGSDGENGRHGQDGQNGQHGCTGPDVGVWVDLYYDSTLSCNLLYVVAENLYSDVEPNLKVAFTSRFGDFFSIM